MNALFMMIYQLQTMPTRGGAEKVRRFYSLAAQAVSVPRSLGGPD